MCWKLREAEERCRIGAEREPHRAEALLDLVLDLLLRHLLAVQVDMRPRVRADRVALGQHLAQDFGMIGRVLADREEKTLGAFIPERLQHRGRVDRPRTVVEGQHDLLVGEEVELLEMLEAEAGSAGGVDLDHAGNAQRVRIGTGRPLLHRHGRSGRRRRCLSNCRRPGRDRRGGLDVILGGELRLCRQLIGGTGGRCFGGALIGARGIIKPTADGDHDRRNYTGQHQAQRITHRYSFQLRNQPCGISRATSH
ncbi:hypothetical protein ACVWZ3_008856 [Bradyrhizobium sp. i1.3.6]